MNKSDISKTVELAVPCANPHTETSKKKKKQTEMVRNNFVRTLEIVRRLQQPTKCFIKKKPMAGVTI